MLPIPDEIFSRFPWNRVYIGQIQDRAGNCHSCWVFFDPRVPTVYHQPEGGFPAEVDFQDIKVVEDSIPRRFCNRGRNIVEEASDAAEARWPRLKKSGGQFMAQQSETASISTITLPKLYQTFDFQHKLGCPKQDKQGGHPADTTREDECVVDLDDPDHELYHSDERQFFKFEAPHEDHRLADRIALILQRRFGTKFPPSVDLIYNMVYFGGSYARHDPRKVFEFHEWKEWLASDRST